MDYAALGSSELEISRVILGTWVMGGWKWGGADREDAVGAIHKAIDLGVTTIDTAPIYGFGLSEEIVGEALAGRRDEVVIATKGGLRWDLEEGEFFFEATDLDGSTLPIYRNLKPDSLLWEIDQSLERLGVDCVDLYQCHWPDETTPIAETMEVMNRILEEGKARFIGVSNFSAEMIEEARRHAPVISDQPEYNMLDRGIEDELLPYCAEHDVGVIAYSPLHQGLLTGKVTMEREFGEDDQRSWKPWFQPQNRRRVLDFLERIRPIADGHGKTLAQLAINWCLCQRGVTAAIVGARRPDQVAENVGAAGWKLSAAELEQIRNLLEELGAPQ
ncbi:MAG: aldo/keto reductase [Candidatus Brocadiia bacterium]